MASRVSDVEFTVISFSFFDILVFLVPSLFLVSLTTWNYWEEHLLGILRH